MPRSNWKGYISFGLVNIPIDLYTSENTEATIKFHQIDRRNQARIQYKRINVETGKEVPWSEIVKAYEYDKDHLLLVEEEALKKIVGDNARTIAIESFVNANAIDFIDVQKTYYLVPQKKAEKGYVILRDALEKTHKIGIAKVIISTKEYLSAVAVYQHSLVLYLLHYRDEIRPLSELPLPGENLKSYQVSNKEIEISKKLILSMSKKWDPRRYRDEYKKAVHRWAEEIMKKKPHKIMQQRAEIRTSKSTDFISLLKKSLASSQSSLKKKDSFVGSHKATKHKALARHGVKH